MPCGFNDKCKMKDNTYWGKSQVSDCCCEEVAYSVFVASLTSLTQARENK